MQKKIIIVAMSEDRVIGLDSNIPWKIRDEQKLFRRATLGHAVVMGRKTYQSIGKPLAGRDNYVISESYFFGKVDPAYRPDHPVVTASSLEVALTEAGRYPEKDIFFIGGSRLYEEAVPLADELHVSWVDGKWRGDTHFPDVTWSEWEQYHERAYEGAVNFTFKKYKRILD